MSNLGAKLPFAGFVPPPTRDAAGGGGGGGGNVVSDRGESVVVQMQWPSAQEVTVATMTRPWRAVDVYLSVVSAIASSGLFTVRVYAVFPGGIRTLVSSGRFGRLSNLVASSTPFGPVWVAAARAQAAVFEVTLAFRAAGGASPITGRVTVAMRASDQADIAPPWVGVEPLRSATGINTFGGVTPDPELVRVRGAVGAAVAAPRYLHVFDLASAIAVAGVAPGWCFPLGSGVGAGGGFGGQWEMGLRSKNGNFQLVGSSTADVTTEVFDCLLGADLR